ncbi:MAG: DUF1631 domain-containing protein [Cellvibrionaceae bacterium]|nr:DUF1631 domain-containing protein [Cellvibrionaceae bacterium]MCV6624731.1 DUF1631 domain-containing protein [Cellvibrionaceae bacterium]
MANGKDNVVPLKAPARAAVKQTLAHKPVETLPRALQAVHLLLSRALQQGLGQFFDNADDALFERADGAGSNVDQSVYFEAMRSLRLARSQLCQAVFAELREDFIRLNNPQRPSAPSVDVYGGEDLFAEDVELVSEDTLERQVAIKTMVSKQLSGHRNNIDHLWRRCYFLLERRGSDDNQRLPSHPQSQCEFFVAQLEALEFPLPVQLLLLKLYERTVLAQLASAYTVINQKLAQQGVMADLQRQISRERRASFNRRQPQLRADTQVQGQALGELHELLGEEQGLLPSAAEAPAADRVQLSRSQLGQLLARVQQAQVEAGPITEAPERAASAAQLKQLLNSSGQVSQLDRNIINLVHLLFEYIWEDPNLAAPMRALLSRMQIPLIKVALVDASFLQAGSHPARQLLNEMARCALGWEEKPGSRDALLNQLQLIVERIQSEFDRDVSLFTELHQQLSKFLKREQRRAELVTQRTVDQARGQALAQQAKAATKAALNKLAPQLPTAAITFLEQGWSRVLQITLLKEGEGSPQWQQKLHLAHKLAQLLGHPERADNKENLAALLARMQRDLDEVGLDSFHCQQWFDGLHAHVRLQPLRREVALDLDAACPAGKSEPVPQEPPKTEAEADLKAAPRLSASDPAMRQARRLNQGAWLLYCRGEQRDRCRLAAILPALGQYIFVDRQGKKLLELNIDALAQHLKAGELQVLNDGQLFDRALQTVIGDLRRRKQAQR